MEISGLSLAPGRFTHGELNRWSVYRRLGGRPPQSGRFRDGKNLLPVPGIETQTVQSVAYGQYTVLTVLSRFWVCMNEAFI
jgi:hypothetical protein